MGSPLQPCPDLNSAPHASRCLSAGVCLCLFVAPVKTRDPPTLLLIPGLGGGGKPTRHSGTLLHLQGCVGLGHPEEAAPTWRQPCGVLLAEEGPSQSGPSLDPVMTTSEDPSPAQPGGTSELRWVLRVWVCRERKGPPVGEGCRGQS